MKKIILLLFAIFSSWQINAQVSTYAFSQSSGTYTPLIGGTTLATYTDAATSIGRMDDQVYNLPAATIPFIFTYDGIGYNGLNVNSNGFITFGETPPTAASYTPNSSTTAYAGSIAAFARDLEGGYVFTADRTIGSPDIVNVSNLGPAQVGDFIDGTGIPAGTTIISIVGSTITLSANALQTGTLGIYRIGKQYSNIQYGVEGVAPNRVFVIQYSNFKRYGTTLATVQHMSLNFQIRLSETSNAINIVYGNCSPGLTNFTTVSQVGLRGPNNTFVTNVNNRLNVKGTSDWATSTPGTSNASGHIFNNVAPANVIASGLTYTWVPPVPCAGIPTPGTVAPVALNLCSGSFPGNLVATGFSSGVSGLTFQWQESPDGVTWGDAVGGTNAITSTYTPPAYLGTPIQYRVRVTCTTSGLFDFSTPTVIGNAVNPTIQVSNANIPLLGSYTASINWTNGNGTRRVVVMSNSATFVDPINGNAPALVAAAVYSGSGQQIMYDGTGTTVALSGLTAMTSYYVKVYEYVRCGSTAPYDYFYNISAGTNLVTISTFSPPANDECLNALSLTVNPDYTCGTVTTGTVAGATASAASMTACSGNEDDDVWFSFMATAGTHQIGITNVLGSATDMFHSLWTGANCNSLALVPGSCSDADISNPVGLTVGQTYYLRVYTYTATVGQNTTFKVCIGTLPSTPPANDNCSGAIALTTGVNFAANAITGNNGGTTASQVADPTIPAPLCSFYSGGDIWYSVTVPISGSITIETGNSLNSGISDTGLVVYSGSCSALVTVECDDDDSLNGLFSIVTLSGRTPGEVLYVRAFEVGNNAFGNFQISAYDCPSGTPAPMGAAAQSFCTSATVANLVTTSTSGTGIKWYTTPTLGTALLPTDALVSGNIYYASQTTTPGCEGLARLAVTVAIDTVLPTTPTGAAVQTFCSANSPTLASLAVNGTGLVWYDAATLGNVLPSTTLLTATTYYVASSAGSCVSSRLAITTTNICPVAPCFNGTLYPSVTFTPQTCNGLVQNSIRTDCWPGEYSNVNVTTGQTYIFGSSVSTDFITISVDGVTAIATGTGTVTWVSTITGTVRFYTHLATCGTSFDNRTRYVTCGIPSLALPDYVNLQFPATATFPQGGSATVYGQVYEAGLTDVVPNVAGQAPGIQAWFGISTTNTNPNTWTNWVPATWNSSSVGNNDEYQATIGATLLPGTYYYATRFNLDNGAYVYGGINASAPNNGNFWDGATFGSGVLTIAPPPAPANDECSGALSVTVNSGSTCTSSTAGTLIGATASTVDAAACFGTEDDDVWFSFVATATTHSIALNNVLGSTTDLYHSLWTGTNCSSLTLVPGTCSDPNTSTPTGLVVGQTYYLRVYSWTATIGQTSTFNVCVGVPPAAPVNDNCTNATVLTPGGVFENNPVTGTVLSATTSTVAIPLCLDFAPTGNSDVWYSVVVPASGNLTIETQQTATNPLFDTLVAAFSGTCGTLTPVGCNDDDGIGNMSLFSLTGQTPGSTLYIGVWKYGTTSPSATENGFRISAYDVSLGNSDFDNASFSYYPNPVKNSLNLSYNQDISSVEVYNLLGQRMSSTLVNATQVEVDMSNLPTAAYIVKVTSNNQVKTIKVMKE